MRSGSQSASGSHGFVERLSDGAEAIGEPLRPWVERLARLGYAAKGLIYLFVGFLALLQTAGHGGKVTDARGALHTAARDTGGFSPAVLGILALGLVGYSLWCFFQAAVDPEGEGRDAKGFAARAGRVLAGIFYFSLALAAYHLATGTGQTGAAGGNAVSWTTRVMAAPLGRLWVGIGGAAFIGVGLYQIMRGYRTAFLRFLDLSSIDTRTRRFVTQMGRFGIAARGVVFCIIGWFLLRAAALAQPGQARGFDKALGALRTEPFGQVLLSVVALGLMAFGAFMIVEARYHRIGTSPASRR